ncbi:hypothetical protein TWF694_004609 [Orbilia ellipsospora]|uniref:Uncharacterized protein n=1 Tax=Orbilia ellipsospora TaxID=2528407 RepID=A0AAV9WVN1_9PEZI
MFSLKQIILSVAILSQMCIAAPAIDIRQVGVDRTTFKGTTTPPFNGNRGFFREGGTLGHRVAKDSGEVFDNTMADPTNPIKVTANVAKFGAKVTADSLKYANIAAKNPTHPGVAGFRV